MIKYLLKHDIQLLLTKMNLGNPLMSDVKNKCPNPPLIPMKFIPLSLTAITLVSLTPCNAALLNVLPGLNNVEITQVIYEETKVTTGGVVSQVTVTQNAPVGTANDGVTPPGSGFAFSNAPVRMNTVQVRPSPGILVDLHFVNSVGATVLNVNPSLASISGVGVFNHTASGGFTALNTLSNAGLPAFSTALASTFSNNDLRNFSFYDFLSSPPNESTPFGTHDYDILYTSPMLATDYIVISERNGNTFFEVTPLDVNGNVIAGANVLRFGGLQTDPANGDAYSRYQWNTGYASPGNLPTQAQALTVAAGSKFFEGTGLTAVPVGGFRIDNDGEADVKMMIFSDTPFENRLIPEPSTFLMGLSAALLFAFSRNRGSRKAD